MENVDAFVLRLTQLEARVVFMALDLYERWELDADDDQRELTDEQLHALANVAQEMALRLNIERRIRSS